MKPILPPLCCLPALLPLTGLAAAWEISCPPDAPPNTQLAAREVRRYVYLRTGELLGISNDPSDRTERISFQLDPALSPQQYRLKTTGTNLTISGGSDVAVLYGSYAFAEKLGVRFYLHGDVIPDERVPLVIPQLDETCQPLFETRGIQPFHDFQEGPDWWNQDDWLAYVGQLPKLRMNFIGLHCYPEGGVGPEPLVWIGRPEDCDAQGRVTFSYGSAWASTDRGGMWGSASVKTGEFAGGASQLFATDHHAPEVMAGLIPRPATPAQCNELFNRVGTQMRTVFAAAKALGVKTCIGTETPLTIPTAVRTRCTDAKTLYTGMFKRIAAACPVDYYWLWTPEGWTWSGNNPAQLEATKQDLQAALAALDELGNPFTLATCGWVLGPAHDRAALDEFLPKTSPMSCINREVGHAGVEPAFANLSGRPKWAIPWLENDPNMVGPQPWVARMRHDAVDARRYGCTGLLGIHWRTKALTMNIAALAAASWDQSWVPAGFDTTPVKPTKGGEGALGGQVVAFNQPVAGTPVSAIYQDVRYDLNGYRLALPNGSYTVTLQLNEPHYAAAGKRVFGVSLQGRQVISNLDIFARVGRNQALDLSFPDIVVSDGTLRLDCTREVEFPCLAGMVIEGRTTAANQLAAESISRLINCGGGAVAGYEADRVSGATAPPSPRHRAMPSDDFYQDFARANFGPAVAAAAGAIFTKTDGVNMPQASDWKNGPGNLVPNPAPWSEVGKRHAFVADFAALRPQVQGAGNLERFDYWLNTWRGAAAMAEACCVRGELDKLMAAKDFPAALRARTSLARLWERLLSLQTSIVSTPGELGTIANLEQHTRRGSGFVEGHDAALAAGLGKPLPTECAVTGAYSGPARLIVPTVRGAVNRGESLQLTIIALNQPPVEAVTVLHRPLGHGGWQTLPARHLGRSVWQAQLPPATDDFEYQITAGSDLVWPATAPQLNQTVVVTTPRP
jgi:hypothetical protein